jgi:hypothetical protein
MRPATAREKLNLFVGLLEEKGNETIRSLWKTRDNKRTFKHN